jgi:hypothetical protein
MNNNIKLLKKLYNEAKLVKVGMKCICPSCNSSFEKKHYQQVFCKSLSGTTCKDNYWNNVTPGKRNNTTRISPSNKKYFEGVIQRDEEYVEDDPSWDAHKHTF